MALFRGRQGHGGWGCGWVGDNGRASKTRRGLGLRSSNNSKTSRIAGIRLYCEPATTSSGRIGSNTTSSGRAGATRPGENQGRGWGGGPVGTHSSTKYFSSGQSLKPAPAWRQALATESWSTLSSWENSSVIHTEAVPPRWLDKWSRRWATTEAGSPVRMARPLPRARRVSARSQTDWARKRARCGPQRQKLATALRAGG